MAILTVQEITLDGLVPSYVAADTAGDKFENNGSTMFHIKNGGGSPITATFTSVRACDQGFLHDVDVVVGAGAEAMVGVFDPYRFNTGAKQVEVSYTAVTSVTVAAITCQTETLICL